MQTCRCAEQQGTAAHSFGGLGIDADVQQQGAAAQNFWGCAMMQTCRCAQQQGGTAVNLVRSCGGSSALRHDITTAAVQARACDKQPQQLHYNKVFEAFCAC